MSDYRGKIGQLLEFATKLTCMMVKAVNQRFTEDACTRRGRGLSHRPISRLSMLVEVGTVWHSVIIYEQVESSTKGSMVGSPSTHNNASTFKAKMFIPESIINKQVSYYKSAACSKG
jgi:hypothetical protein